MVRRQSAGVFFLSVEQNVDMKIYALVSKWWCIFYEALFKILLCIHYHDVLANIYMQNIGIIKFI